MTNLLAMSMKEPNLLGHESPLRISNLPGHESPIIISSPSPAQNLHPDENFLFLV